MYEKIVIGSDGSETAGVALQRAATLATMCGAELHLVYGTGMPTDAAAIAGFDAVGHITPDTISRLEGMLEDQAAKLRSDELTVQTHVVLSTGADAIIGVAEEIGADLIVVGNRGMSGARRFLLGSVPNSVTHHAPCSVLVVRTV